jgi:predicted dehydrogenase
VLGYGFETAKSVLANRRPEIRLLDSDNKLLEEKATKTADDTIFLTGTLKSGIPLSFSLRGGRPFKGQPGLDWRIYGSKAELRITASGLFLNVGSADIKVEIHDFEADTVEEIPLPKDEFEGKEGFGFSARNVARVYKALAKGENNATFEDAVERHEFIEQLYKENGYVEGSA